MRTMAHCNAGIIVSLGLSMTNSGENQRLSTSHFALLLFRCASGDDFMQAWKQSSASEMFLFTDSISITLYYAVLLI